MPKPRFWILLMITTLLSCQLYAQKQSKKKKAVQQKTVESIGVYLKKKLVYKFNKEQYLRFRDSINFKTNDDLRKINDHKIEWRPSKIPFKPLVAQPPVIIEKDAEEKETELVNIYNNNRLVRTLGVNAYRRFKDSIAIKTKDTLFAISDMRVEIHSYQPSKNAKPVRNAVSVNNKGYLTVQLPLANTHRYKIIFFVDAIELFQVDRIHDTQLTFDKTNFVHAGWFTYELYENDKLKEKGKFFLSKETGIR